MTQATYAVIHDGAKWRISHAGQHYGYYDSAAQAQQIAIETAQAAVTKGLRAQVVLRQANEAFALVWTSDAKLH